MRIRTIIATLSVAAAAFVGVGEPAHAAKPGLQQIGRGTWTTDGAGASFTGETAGVPVAGTTTGFVGPDDGSNPPWPGCEPGSGSMTTTDNGKSLTVELWGNICTAVHPDARLVFIGWYRVTHFDAAKGRRVADGVGGIDVRSFGDGTIQWMMSGDLY
jgi:hypothetical protein